LKDRLPLLKGRCASCKFKEFCAGGLRARAEISTGDPWASDPGCYLTDEEIGLTPATSPTSENETLCSRC
jgi:MoaA/NifB/PqqE/SkfB family radical SAM enzyme